MPFAIIRLRVSTVKFTVIVCDGETFLFVDSPDKQKTQSLRPLRLCGELSEPSSALICEKAAVSISSPTLASFASLRESWSA